MKKTLLRHSLALLAAALLCASLGCGLADKLRSASNTSSTPSNGTSPSNSSTSPYDPTKTNGPKLYESADQIHQFVAALTAAVGSDNPNLLKLSFYDTYASAEVQDPNKPDNVDGYSWRDGKLSPPAPVKIIGDGKISDNVFPLKDVNLDGLPALTKEVMDKLKDVEGGTMIGYVVSRNLPFSKDIHIDPLTNATRKSVYSEADKDAKLKK
ncbi:MAG: hypothetical protein JO053_08385, partial [Acidobacteria bacterium]|nr:hypothetical protein [Acidobacteriota bacterium]